jgi:hypothetical protein
MAYAFVQDTPAPWRLYEVLAAAAPGEPAPDGLIVHVAGPTASGFRVIDVWESREAYERFRLSRVGDEGVPPATPTPAIDELDVRTVVRPAGRHRQPVGVA